MPRTLFSAALALLLLLFPASARPAGNEKSLRIYFIDVEGGQSTLLSGPCLNGEDHC